MDVAHANLPRGKAGIKMNEMNICISLFTGFESAQLASEQVPLTARL